MILSMTGYGRKTFELNGKNIVIEIKSLNSKAFDLNLRLPNILREMEIDIRNALSKYIIRGKIDCIIGYEQTDETKNSELNSVAIKEYYRQLKTIAGELHINDDAKIFDLVFRLPNITTPPKEELTEADWNIITNRVQNVCEQVTKFRVAEGIHLEKDLLLRNAMVKEVLNEIEKIDPQRVEHQRNSLTDTMNAYVSTQEFDKNRFEQELIYYIEKMDITEEITRLRSHCDYFAETIYEPIQEKGKKLAFICQEMGREINTIGSKAYHAAMQKCVVMMKDELEKIKEQLNNVL